MDNEEITKHMIYINPETINFYNGPDTDKDTLFSMIYEWNSSANISDLCEKWVKVRPKSFVEHLTLLEWNCEGLSTHMTDFDQLLASYSPHIFLLSGVGKQIHKLPHVPNFKWYSANGTNSFGGVGILVHQKLRTSLIEETTNFVLIEIEIMDVKIYIASIYVPPGSMPPLEIFDKHKDKEIFIFGDFNAKHQDWKCEYNNTSGNKLKEWLIDNGFDILHPHHPTSKRSRSVIDFGIGKNKERWGIERLLEGNSDHYPVLFLSPFPATENGFFRKTNWKLFTFFLEVIYCYWNTLVYETNYNTFFDIFSQFLAALSDRCTDFEQIKNFRPPWPPYLVELVRTTNKFKRKFRKSRFFEDYKIFRYWENMYKQEKLKFDQEKRENKIKQMKDGQNIWSHVRQIFKPYSPTFRGLKTSNCVVKDNQEIANQLANFYEKHFAEPMLDSKNDFHLKCLVAYENIKHFPNIPLEQIKIEEVILQWKKFAPKKSLDSVENSAFLLKQIPTQYLGTITVLFNRCAADGKFFEGAKIAKGIFLSKDGLFPTVDRLRSISLLPNIGKVFEKVLVTRIEKWCNDQGIHLDEQSGFTPKKRLQSRVLGIVEDLRLTIAAPNRAALALFIDFSTAFDRLWWPALFYTLERLEMPIELRKWIFNWLQNRWMRVSHGDARSRLFPILVGAPQGSILAAVLFRLHVHFLPMHFPQTVSHLFADDLTLIIKSSLENRLTENIEYLQYHAKIVLSSLEKFSDNYILPVNVVKTKAMIVHNAVIKSKPEIEYKGIQIEYVTNFKCLGVYISAKLGWGKFIEDRIQKVRNSYNCLRKIYHTIPQNEIKIRRRLFLAFSLPQFIWLFFCFFHFTEKQKQKIEHIFGIGLRLVYSLWGYDDIVTLTLSREFSLRDYLYKYWIKFQKHLDTAPEANTYRQTLTAYFIAKSPFKEYYNSMSFRKNSRFPKRLAERANHIYLDVISFIEVHREQYGFFKKSSLTLEYFILKYFCIKPP